MRENHRHGPSESPEEQSEWGQELLFPAAAFVPRQPFISEPPPAQLHTDPTGPPRVTRETRRGGGFEIIFILKTNKKAHYFK